MVGGVGVRSDFAVGAGVVVGGEWEDDGAEATGGGALVLLKVLNVGLSLCRHCSFKSMFCCFNIST